MLRKKRLPIGYEDFKQIIDGNFYYVDKSMLIYDLLNDGWQNNLITRPRRFGKTLNMSMLRYFFDITEKDNAYIFDGLKISEHYDELAGYRNAFPVITLSLKCGKQGDHKRAIGSICREIRAQYDKYSFILESDRLTSANRADFINILNCQSPDEEAFNESIKLLSRCLMQYYGKKVIILIDEYDVPLEDAYFSGYYDKMVTFIRSLFESALKTNPALEFSVITGCLRISKESIFTGLNNLRVNSILDTKYSEYFGFEESEVKAIFDEFGLSDKFVTAKKWYDGYMFGNTEVYNPWSIVNYVADLQSDPDAFPAADWANSSSNNIIRMLVADTSAETREKVECLVNGGCIETGIRETTTYGDLKGSSEDLWSFLFFTGYLTKRSVRKTEETALYSLAIPNVEIRSCYREIIMDYFEPYRRAVDRDALLKSLLSGDADGFAERITELLQKSISFYDSAEQFYHGLIAGLLSGNIYYRVVSNRETGSGRSDLMLYQQDRAQNAVILEFKVCRGNEMPDEAAKRALEQIEERGYDAEARELGYKRIIKYGVAFKGKVCCAAVRTDGDR